jgi:hypothetical protein
MLSLRTSNPISFWVSWKNSRLITQANRTSVAYGLSSRTTGANGGHFRALASIKTRGRSDPIIVAMSRGQLPYPEGRWGR